MQALFTDSLSYGFFHPIGGLDHLLAMLPVFELRPYQSITGQMSSPN